jgi:hypothetical protein
MAVRFRFRAVTPPTGSMLAHYWGVQGYFRPEIDLYVVGPTGIVVPWIGHIDTCSDFVVFDDRLPPQLGLSAPFSRVVGVSGIAGAAQAQFTMPPDGTVSLFLTDYREWYFLPAPPVGFWPASPAGTPRRNVLGVTGFLQHFQVFFDYKPKRPEVELIEFAGFPGRFGTFEAKRPLHDFIRGLKFPP